jgi:hypothetical protein
LILQGTTNTLSITDTDGISVTGGTLIDTITFTSGVTATTVDSGAGADVLVLNGTNTLSIADSAGGISVTGGTGVDTITFTTAVTATTVLGGSGADVITFAGSVANTATVAGGTGADSINLGATHTGAVKVTSGNGDSIAATALTLAGTAFAANDTITFGNGVDVITNFIAGATKDSLDVTTPGAAITGIGVTAASLTATKTLFLSGAYNTTTKVFTIAADAGGADTLIVDTADTAAATADTWVVLVGVVTNTLHADNFV